jgi:hypothetical protein
MTLPTASENLILKINKIGVKNQNNSNIACQGRYGFKTVERFFDAKCTLTLKMIFNHGK